MEKGESRGSAAQQSLVPCFVTKTVRPFTTRPLSDSCEVLSLRAPLSRHEVSIAGQELLGNGAAPLQTLHVHWDWDVMESGGDMYFQFA